MSTHPAIGGSVTGGVCNALNGLGQSCGRFVGHDGMHYDRAHTSMWLGHVEPAPEYVKPPSRLSVREIEVLQGLADGLKVEGIAAKLFLSSNTVKTHKARIAKRLGTESSAHAVAWGFRNGVLK